MKKAVSLTPYAITFRILTTEFYGEKMVFKPKISAVT